MDFQEWAVPKVGVTASKPGRIFAGTRGDGVWLSEDFGSKVDQAFLRQARAGQGALRRRAPARFWIRSMRDASRSIFTSA